MMSEVQHKFEIGLILKKRILSKAPIIWQFVFVFLDDELNQFV